MNVLDSDDEELFFIYDYINRPRRPRIIRDRPDYYQILDETDFFRRFRVNKNVARVVHDSIVEDITSRTDRNRAVSSMNRLLVTLRFYATGSIVLTMADFSGISKSSATHFIKIVTHAIATRLRHQIRMPTLDEMPATRQRFFRIASFPKVCGALDCTHIKIESPGGPHAEYYRNRKGFFSFNVQAICDGNLVFLDMVARWPGSCHDQTIFNNSRIKNRMEAGEFNNHLLLGDSGYENRPYLVTPLLDPRTRPENLYNESQIRTRNVVERCFGVWKRRFPILKTGIKCMLLKAQGIIIATAILHNLAIKNGNIPAEILVDDDDIPVLNAGQVLNVGNDAKRRELIELYFNRLALDIPN